MRIGFYLPGFAVLAMFVSVVAPAASPNWSEDDLVAVERCVGFILLGPQTNGIKIRGEGFNCKPLGLVTVAGGGVLNVSTQLSHQLTARPDDQFAIYISMYPTGKLMSVNHMTNSGGIDGILHLRAAGNLENLSGKQLIVAVTSGATDRSWRGTAGVITSVVAIEVSRSLRNKDSSPAFLVGRPGYDIGHTELLDGHHYGRNDINSRFPNTYWQACASLCSRTSGCKAWSLSRARKPICSMKGPGTDPVLDSDGISGISP